MASNMIESRVEHYLVSKITRIGGLCLKFCSTGQAGVPDRVVIYDGRVVFVELKRPGEEPRALQKAVAKKLRKAGGYVYCLSTLEQVDRFTRDIMSGWPADNAYDTI